MAESFHTGRFLVSLIKIALPVVRLVCRTILSSALEGEAAEYMLTTPTSRKRVRMKREGG